MSVTHWPGLINTICGTNKFNPELAATKEEVTCKHCKHTLYPALHIVNKNPEKKVNKDFNNSRRNRRCKCSRTAMEGSTFCCACLGIATERS